MNKQTIISYLFIVVLYSNCNENTSKITTKQNNSLKDSIYHYIQTIDANIGVAILHIENSDTITLNNNYKYPMQSVYKLPLCFALLSEIEKGKFSLNQKIHVAKYDLPSNTWSPLRDSFPNGNIDLSIAELINYTICKRDNNTCDILFKLLGGTQVAEKYIQSIGYKHINIKTTEAEMRMGDDSIAYTNWCYPTEINQLLVNIFNGKHLNKANTEFLIKTLTETSTGPNRLKGLLQKDIIVAHKTGSGKNIVNDVGIINLPNGNHIAISVFIDNAKIEYEDAEKVIANISKMVIDFYIKSED